MFVTIRSTRVAAAPGRHESAYVDHTNYQSLNRVLTHNNNSEESQPYATIQTGDPTGTGRGGDSIYGDLFKDELHSRIKFNHRGQVAMANAVGGCTSRPIHSSRKHLVPT